MAKHGNFTASRIDGFECAPGKQQSLFWDGKTPGLGLRVTAANAKSYFFETRLHGKTIRKTIGDVRTWTLIKAQAEATRLKTMTDQGKDPRQAEAEQAVIQENQRQQAKLKSMLVGEAWSHYLEHHSSRWGARHMADHINLSQPGGQLKKRGAGLTVQGVIYPLLEMRMGNIHADKLSEWQSGEVGTRANNARQGYELFRAFWRWCGSRSEYREFIDTAALDSRDLRAEVPTRKNKRFDVLERAKLAGWFSAVRGLSNPVHSAYLQGLLLTGARRDELAELRWVDVDFRWNAIWIKDKVANEGRKVPLTPYFASLLQSLPHQNEWVFSSPTSASGRIVEPRGPHNRALSIAGLDHVTVHGLRRTFASLAEWVEMPRGVVAQIMGHSPRATAEKHYINRPLELLAIWHCKYEAWILEQAGVEYLSGRAEQKLKVVHSR
ncbi:integrase family protein [Silvimonas sp.]|uniref:tyrosine-type recombinase/integrase n=1 Tax=Silvimonas sp. TaxID=2650811 RepID=UPI0028485B58|nr:integrase family protein [Silvimonas sp.]MDR3429596.1 integrase family protein [Silvimonas sp.]